MTDERYRILHFTERTDLLDAGFTEVCHQDPQDQKNDRSFYTRVEHMFRIRVVIPNTPYGRPALYIGLRLKRFDDQWLDARSVFRTRVVREAVDNGLGFLSVVRVV
jgi:hypothetical protein